MRISQRIVSCNRVSDDECLRRCEAFCCSIFCLDFLWVICLCVRSLNVTIFIVCIFFLWVVVFFTFCWRKRRKCSSAVAIQKSWNLRILAQALILPINHMTPFSRLQWYYRKAHQRSYIREPKGGQLNSLFIKNVVMGPTIIVEKFSLVRGGWFSITSD